MAEALLTKLGKQRFRVYSAGSHPTGKVHALAIELLESLGYSTRNLRSKSWTEFAGQQSPHLDLVITVCDRAASETCPVWPGGPVQAHWSLPDPASVEGSHAARIKAFSKVFNELERRIKHLVDLPLDSLTRKDLIIHLRERNC